jgi:glucosamine 6-phosphate synthetase-like amidotransferase/phosphosugar isomerase protein
MCGIAGAILPNATPQERHRIASNLLFESIIRGTDAAGIGYHENGQVVIVKNGVSAKEFIREEQFLALNDKLPSTFIVHTRATTQGSEKTNGNNHPVTAAASGIILVHNGTVDDKYWRATNEDGTNPYIYGQFTAQVDTECIPILVETMRYIPRGADFSVDPEVVEATPKENWKPTVSWLRAIDDAAANLEGSFACAMLVPEEPDTLYLWRHSSPLVVAYVPEWDGIVFASEAKILERALCEVEVKTIFGVFEQKQYNMPEYYATTMEDCSLWKVERVGVEDYNVQQFDIEPPFYNRRSVKSNNKGVVPVTEKAIGYQNQFYN